MIELAHTTLTRRRFLGTSAAVLGANALPSLAAAQPAKFRRFEISDPNMPSRVLDSYKKGIREMLNLPPTHPRNWYRNAFIHVFDCPHQNWWFLVWHRGYIGWLEATIRELSGDKDFALPYWDWTKTPRVPNAMFADVLDPNNSAFIPTFDKFKSQFEAPIGVLWSTFSQAQKNVLAERGLSSPADFWNAVAAAPAGMFFEQPNARGLTAANPDLDPPTKATVKMSTIRSALRTRRFTGSASGTGSAGFASAQASSHSDSSREGILESQPHDNVHGAMGGPSGNAFMVSFLSSVDPIFFLHHANLDRLWDVWTRRQAALGRPTLPQGADLSTWSGEQFLFFSDQNGQPVSKTKAGDYSSMAAFDYDYSPGSGEDQVPTAPVVAAAPPTPTEAVSAQITSASIGAGPPAGGVAQVPAAALAAAGPDAAPQVAEVTLNLGPADQGRRFRVLISAGGGSPVDAGAITVFSHHVHGPTTFTVPLPEEVAANLPAGGNVPVDIRVVPLEPAGATAAGPAKADRSPRSGMSAARVAAISVRAD
jgi:tyrosinase